MFVKNKMLSIVAGLVFIAVIFFLVYFLQSKIRSEKSLNIIPVSFDQTDIFKSTNKDPLTTITKETSPPKETLPESYLLFVPFQAQAPFGDWSEPYENACEEASIIMVKYYFQKKALSKDQMKEEIDAAVDWEINKWGSHRDLDAKDTAILAKEYFGLNGKVVSSYGIEYLQEAIHSGKPIIAPTAGRKLGNPNFRGIGPEYHMLVLIGYDNNEKTIITNDPGTRNGKSYVYNQKILLDAVSGPKENMAKDLVILTK